MSTINRLGLKRVANFGLKYSIGVTCLGLEYSRVWQHSPAEYITCNFMFEKLKHANGCGYQLNAFCKWNWTNYYNRDATAQRPKIRKRKTPCKTQPNLSQICPVLKQIHLVILSVCLDLIRYYLPLSLHSHGVWNPDSPPSLDSPRRLAVLSMP